MRAPANQTPVVPRFFLYGEPARPVESRFVHLEDLEDRSAPSSWTIRPHVHADLHQIFYITAGGGELSADAERLRYRAPCIMVIPAGVVHGIAHIPQSKGWVLTFADSYLQNLALQESGFAEIHSGCAWIAAIEDGELAGYLGRLSRELGWAAPGHAAAVDAHMTTLLVEALRLYRHAESEVRRPRNQQAQLVARFRQLIEAHHRETRDIETYARWLGVTPSRLRAACRAAAGSPPTRILYDRLALEARRLMHYSSMSITEMGYYLGFDDPAYFSRFFTKTLGVSPRRFRSRARSVS